MGRHGLFFVYFWLFQTYKNVKNSRLSIPVLGFELVTSQT